MFVKEANIKNINPEIVTMLHKHARVYSSDAMWSFIQLLQTQHLQYCMDNSAECSH